VEGVEWVLTWEVKEVVNLGVEAPVEVLVNLNVHGLEALAKVVREAWGRLVEAFDCSGSLAALAFVAAPA